MIKKIIIIRHLAAKPAQVLWYLKTELKMLFHLYVGISLCKFSNCQKNSLVIRKMTKFFNQKQITAHTVFYDMDINCIFEPT